MLPWLVIGICGIPALLGWFSLYIRQPLNVPVFLAALEKLIRAGKHDRAERLCRAMPQALPAKLALIVLTVDVSKADADRQAFGYRQVSEGRPFEERLGEAVAPAVQDASRRIHRAFGLTLLGLLPLPAVWLLGARWGEGSGSTWLGLGIALALLALLAIGKWHANRRGLELVLRTLAPVVEECPREERAP